MDPFALIEQTWWLGVPVALLLGVLLGANPAALPILGAAVGVGASGELGSRGAGVRQAAAFGAGLALVYAAVGLFVGRIDRLAEEVMRPYAGIAYLVLAALLGGLALFVAIRPQQFCARCAAPPRRNLTLAGAFLAGIPAGFINCPACSGVIFGVATSAATLSPVYAGVVMLALGIGHLLVLVVLAWWLTRGWSPPERLLVGMQRLSALVLLALAAYLLRSAWLVGLTPGPRLI